MPGGYWDTEGLRAPAEEDPPIGGGWMGGGVPGPGPAGPNTSQAGGFASRFNLDSPSPWSGGMNRRRKPFRQPFQSPYQTAQTRPAWEQSMGGAPSPARGEFEGITDPTERRRNYWQTIMGDFASGNAGQLSGEALMNMIIGGKGQGMWGPEGDPRVMQAYDDDASRRGLAMEQSAVLGADMDGGDFWNRGLARTLARSNASRMRGDFFNQNRLNNASRYQALTDALLRGKLGGQFTMDDDYTRDRWAANREGANRGGGLGGMIGSIAGAGLGALAGQPGLGAGIGGMLGGGGGSDFPRYNYMGSGQTYR